MGDAASANWFRRTWSTALLTTLLAASLSGNARADARAGATGSQEVAVWITTADHAKALAPVAAAEFGARRRLPLHIDVDPDRSYQRMVGFGASLTDASAWLIQHKLDQAQRNALLHELFGR